MAFDLQAYKDHIYQDIHAKEIEIPLRISTNNRWVLVSSLQKSIRRGDKQSALRSAYTLFLIDPNYLYWRLRIMASEDISLGDPVVANKVILFSSYQKEFEFKNKQETLLSLISDACDAVKDKASHYSGWWLQNNYSDYFDIIRLNGNDLVNRFNKSGMTIYDKVMVIWCLIGTKYVPLGDLDLEGDHELLPQVLSGVSDNAQGLFFMSMEKQKESHFISAPVMDLFYDKFNPSKEGHSITNPLNNLGVSLASIDAHTSDGRKNILEYISGNRELRLLMGRISSNQEDQIKHFGGQLFLKSGNLVGRHLWSKAHSSLYSNIVKMKGSKINIERYVDSYISQYMSAELGHTLGQKRLR